MSDERVETFSSPAIVGCYWIGTEDGCCTLPGAPTPECWIGSQGSTCCPILEGGRLSGARERLIEAAARELDDDPNWVYSDEGRIDGFDTDKAAPVALDAFLDHPDDLIECLVEAGALHSWQHEAEGPGQTGRVHYERVNTATSEGGTE